ncbi:hypothetical protein EYV94_04260 [Puteibacter caeruleilacunae]|nr:hypothetical protein EYV94_04260 [Puteibacter caeruleilacunae]
MIRLYIYILVSFISISAMGQVEDAKTITLTANLNSTLILSVDKHPITFNFDSEDQYEKGIGGKKNELTSSGSVLATTNWKLSCKATSQLIHEDGITTLPLNNLGVRAEMTGDTPIRNLSQNSAIALALQETTILDYDGIHSNANDDQSNAFKLYWEMGTKSGNMNKQSIMEQDLKKGSYSTQIEIIATEVMQ